MRKKYVIIAVLCCVLIFIIFVPLPHTSKVTLHTVKLDASGREVGRVDIPVEYTVSRSLFVKDLKSVDVGEFDGVSSKKIRMIDRPTQMPMDYYVYTIVVGNLTGDLPTPENPSLDSLQGSSYRYIFHVDKDYDRWMIRVLEGEAAEEEFLYVASVSGKHAPQEMLEFFEFKPVN